MKLYNGTDYIIDSWIQDVKTCKVPERKKNTITCHHFIQICYQFPLYVNDKCCKNGERLVTKLILESHHHLLHIYVILELYPYALQSG